MHKPGLEEQVEAVRAARDHLARSVEWRAGRKGFNKARHARDVARLDAAIATLRNLREAEAQQP